MILSRVVFLYNFLIFILTNRFIPIKEIKKLKRVGNGLSNTFIFENRYVIKIKNQIREKVNVRLYKGKYNGFFYDVKNKLQKEYETLNFLNKYNLSPKGLYYNNYYLIIEYIDSITLSNYLKNSKNYTIFDKVIKSINKMHSLNIFHGDLNLDNILITPNEEIKFIDFESSFDDKLSLEEKKELEFKIMEEKMQRFYPEIYREYNEISCRD